MTNHLSTLQVKQLCVSALPDHELTAAAVHTAECMPCHRRFVAELKRQHGSTPFNFTLEPEFWFRHDHVEFEQLVAIADKNLDHETEEIVTIHLKTCETCREDVRSFLGAREATAHDMDLSYGRPESQPIPDAGSGPWWHQFQRRPVYAMAAIALMALAVLIAVIAPGRRSNSFEAGKHDEAIPHVVGSPGISSSPLPNVVASPSNEEQSTKVAILNDRSGEVTIDKSGHVTGLDEVSENSREYVARAALSEHIEPADVLRHLSGDHSGLRSIDNGEPGFRLLNPVESVVIEDRPVFRWESLPRVSSYRVYVMDDEGKQILQSEELPPNQTRWKAPTPLRRGKIFSWVVIAVVDDKRVISPSASRPEIKFAVLSTSDFQEWGRLKKSNSHLALGVFFARTGLLKEAEGEFQSLVRLNPQSELARKLLQSVRSMRPRTSLKP